MKPTMPAPIFGSTITQDYLTGQAHYGDINLPMELFVGYVWGITCKHVKDPSDYAVALNFAKSLYLRDLYLTCGCVNHGEKAWETFDHRYRRFVTDLVRFCYRQGTDQEEVADVVLVSLCLPDRSGHQRIASYDGRSSLATWLRVIVVNRAINERSERKTATDDSVTDIADWRAIVNIEAAVLAQRYSSALTDSLTQAFQTLTSRERLMLLWRYEDNLQLGEIAKYLGIHQSNVTRQITRLLARMREKVTQILASQHHLSPSAIQECLADITENPHHSISLVKLIKDTPRLFPATQHESSPTVPYRAAGGR